MNRLSILFTIVLLLFTGSPLVSFAQNDMDGIERRLVDLFGKLKNRPDDAEKLSDQCMTELKLALEGDPEMLYPFENLKNTIQVLRSDDGALRIFSWALTLADGSQKMNSLAQFWNDEGYTRVISLHNPDGLKTTAALWHVIHQMKAPTGNKYLILGWGNERPDFQHRSARLLEVQGIGLQDCNKCMAGKMFVEVHAPAAEEISLTFDPFNTVLRYPEYLFNEISDTYRATGKVSSLFWRDGIFIPAP